MMPTRALLRQIVKLYLFEQRDALDKSAPGDGAHAKLQHARAGFSGVLNKCCDCYAMF